LSSVHADAIHQKLNPARHPHHDKYVAGVWRGENLDICEDTVIRLGQSGTGAFVMTWSYVHNVDVGIPNPHDDEDALLVRLTAWLATRTSMSRKWLCKHTVLRKGRKARRGSGVS
jgi:hypothetical protein